MRIKISADSTCDLSKELVEKYDIGIIPLYVVKGGQSLKDGLEISPGDIFEYVDSGAGICTTAAVNYADYHEKFSGWLAEYDAVIHVDISSEMSACYQTACLVAEELGNVYVVDSRNLSTGSGHLVVDAAELAARGYAPLDIKAELERRADKVEASFVIDTLKYLHKGGRCSAVAAMGANLLNLKPCIEVRDGEMGVAKKYRGHLGKCLESYVADKLAGRDDLDHRRIFITHSRMDRAIVNKVIEQVRQTGPWEEIHETDAGCTVSNHCGPGTLGVLYYTK